MWLEGSGECGTLSAEMWWAGKREGSYNIVLMARMTEVTAGLEE